jgi:hypothetical protein
MRLLAYFCQILVAYNFLTPFIRILSGVIYHAGIGFIGLVQLLTMKDYATTADLET